MKANLIIAAILASITLGVGFTKPTVRSEYPVLAPVHHPHDVVDDVDLTPGFPEDGSVFVASSGSMNLFLISRNQGFTWVNARSGMRGFRVSEFETASDYKTSKTAYAALGWGGLQRTRDAGRTWDPPLKRGNFTQLCVPPVAPDGSQVLFYGGVNGLWRSDDGGKTSTAIVSMKGKRQIQLHALAASPNFHADKTVAAAVADQLFLSTDGGKNWGVTKLNGAPKHITFSPNYVEDNTMWVGTHGASVQRSTDGGQTFRDASIGIVDPDVNFIVTAPTYPKCRDLFAATRDEGVYRSQDGGDTWDLVNLEVERTYQTKNHYLRLAISPQYPENPTIYVGTFEGLYISNDAGETWIESNINPTRIGRLLETSPSYKDDGTVYISTYGTPLLVSNDRGDSWDIAIRDFNSMSPYSLGVAPNFDKNPLVIVGTAWGLRRSADGGKSWEQFKFEPLYNNEKFNLKPFETREVVFSPDFEEDSTIYVANAGGFYKSTDAGKTWSGRAVVTDWCWRFAMSPEWTKDRTLFQGGLTLHRSTDDGETWSKPLFRDKVNAIVCAPDYGTTGEVYVVGQSKGFWRSTDGGASFQNQRDAFESYSPSTLRKSPDFATDNTLYVSTLAGGLFVSRDRGLTWQRMTPLGSEVDTCFSFCLSPNMAEDKTMFAGTFEGIWRSTDLAASWKLITDVEMYDDMRDPWMLRGMWQNRKFENAYSFGARSSRTTGSEITLPFTGTGARIFGIKSPEHGKAAVLLNGEVVEEIDCYATELDPRAVLYENMSLPWAYHDLTVRVLGEKSADSKDVWVSVDGGVVAYQGPEGGVVPVNAAAAHITLPKPVRKPKKADDQPAKADPAPEKPQPDNPAPEKPQPDEPAPEEPQPNEPATENAAPKTPTPTDDGEQTLLIAVTVGAGVALLALLVFAFLRRNRKNAAA